jgi:hypothetical protein
MRSETDSTTDKKNSLFKLISSFRGHEVKNPSKTRRVWDPWKHGNGHPASIVDWRSKNHDPVNPYRESDLPKDAPKARDHVPHETSEPVTVFPGARSSREDTEKPLINIPSERV